jgi:hypothetical protein|eukprot:COSAG06_NODE_5779_length_3278_cov_1.731677_3_plen_49_part_00
MIYEGTTQHPLALGDCWGDTIGLSRSKVNQAQSYAPSHLAWPSLLLYD